MIRNRAADERFQALAFDGIVLELGGVPQQLLGGLLVLGVLVESAFVVEFRLASFFRLVMRACRSPYR